MQEIREEDENVINLDSKHDDTIDKDVCLSWFKSRLLLPGYSNECWTPDHENTAKTFLFSSTTTNPAPKVLFAWLDEENELHLQSAAPSSFPDRAQYFLRQSLSSVTPDNVEQNVRYGPVSTRVLESLLRVLTTVYAPLLMDTGNWPVSVKSEFSTQLHRFIASLSESINYSKGVTVLYVPLERIDDVEKASKDKDLVQRLETALVRWTRQVKDVIGHQDTQPGGELSDPLTEIQHWQSRCTNLSGIDAQLNKPVVKQVVEVLNAARSAYIKPFAAVSQQISFGAEEARENLRYLSTLREPCQKMAQAPLSEMLPLLTSIAQRAYMIYLTSPHYGSQERLTSLLCKVSGAVIFRCSKDLSLDSLFDGDVSKTMTLLRESIAVGEGWRRTCLNEKKKLQHCAEVVARTSNSSNTLSVERSSASPTPRPRANSTVKMATTRRRTMSSSLEGKTSLVEQVKDLHLDFEIDDAAVFAHMEAFIQRCRDLTELCQGMVQFCRRKNRESLPLPVFGGAQGPEITKALGDIEKAFIKACNVLRGVGYDVLDVKSTKWYEDFSVFKKSMRDLDVMMQDVINMAFESITPSVVVWLPLLKSFWSLGITTTVRHILNKKAADLYGLFLKEIMLVKKEFESYRRNPALRLDHPKYSGAVIWASGLKTRLVTLNNVLLEQTWLDVVSREKDECISAYNQVVASLDEFSSRTQAEWVKLVEDYNFAKKLASSVLVRVNDGTVECNLDHQLMKILAEHPYVDNSGLTVPDESVMANGNVYVMTREHVMSVLRDYNSLLCSLNVTEKKLFKERLSNLEQLLNVGTSTQSWSDCNAVAEFLADCRAHLKDVSGLITDFKDWAKSIVLKCNAVAETELLSITKKKIYSESDFETSQRARLTSALSEFKSAHAKVIDILNKMYETFKDDGTDVQNEWKAFVSRADDALAVAFSTSMKQSLGVLIKAICKPDSVAPNEISTGTTSEIGSGSTHTIEPSEAATKADSTPAEQQPLFHVQVVLQGNKIAFTPTLVHLSGTIDGLVTFMIDIVKDITRLKSISSAEDQPSRTFHEVLHTDSQILKLIATLKSGMTTGVAEVSKFLSVFDKYKHVYELDKDAFMRRYARESRPLVIIEADITKYRDLVNEILNEEALTAIALCRVDCTPLKHSLVQACNAWQTKFTDLLNNNARSDLKALVDFFKTNSDKLHKLPTSLEELGSCIDLVESVKKEMPNIDARIEPLRTQYRMLDKFEVHVNDAELDDLDNIDVVRNQFVRLVGDTDSALLNSKERFRSALLRDMEDFAISIRNVRDNFAKNGPFDASIGNVKAMRSIDEFRAQVGALRDTQQRLARGQAIFGIQPPPHKELDQLQSDLDQAFQLWSVYDEWEQKWDQYKTCTFANIQISEMETVSQGYSKKIIKLGHDCKQWNIWQTLRDKMEQFKRTLPLIQDLRDPALRERHWEQLMEEVGKTFVPTSPDFTLERIFSLGLDQCTEVISNITTSAHKELSIEEAINDVEKTWNDMKFDMVPYRDGVHKVGATDKLFEKLEDNMVKMASMKSSKYFRAFEAQIEFWERTLTDMLETVELILTVQRTWMYLENIFGASEDIRRQLPAESTMFDNVNGNWKFIIDQLVKDSNVQRGTHTDGLVDMLHDMNGKLEKIQKSLDLYLESKRRAFPRFYFLSDDDLLEILGQARDPSAVQTHLKKCFANIVSLRFGEGRDGKRLNEAIAMKSAEGEEVPFHVPVVIDGPAEGWLVQLETAMFNSLRHQLQQCLASAKKSKKDKWVGDWPGQLLLVAGQIAWTADVSETLHEAAGGEKNALKLLRRRQISNIHKLSAMVETDISEIDRQKLIALITIEVHNRDVVEKLTHNDVKSPDDFDWLSQLRYYWDKDEEDCVVRQTDTSFAYGYEYIGNSGRLVVTPLTDRCYMTLTTAMHLRRGGSPQGPAGTGKTETVKDLGKGLGKYVIVFNCSDSMDYKSLGRMFRGFAQTGAWGCFDEFNRIQVEVLSVVAQQVACILEAIRAGVKSFDFEGHHIPLNPTLGIFITMNPGYAGRSELPDNLKSLFRPIAMMVPDAALIAEIMLFSEGFKNAKELSRKIDVCYRLSRQQLSKQDHYDFGLRNIKSVLITAGSIKRSQGALGEDLVLLKAIKDMNMPKLVGDDVHGFSGIVSDLFPGVDLPVIDKTPLQIAVEETLVANDLMPIPQVVDKVMQLYDTKRTRHGVMLVGGSGTGKTTIWRTLQAAMTKIHESTDPNVSKQCQLVRSYVLNPKAITMGDLFGEYNPATRDWTDGVLSNLLRQASRDDKPDEKWIVFDGPVDTLWIESMNTVLDDSKLLTLNNGERIAIPPPVSLLFEVGDLSQASPATVSRCGMVYLDNRMLGWKPYSDSWLARRTDKEGIETLKKLFTKFVQPALDFKKGNCTELVKITDLNAIISFCSLFDAVATIENGVNPADPDFYHFMLELWFIFCVIWSIGGALDEESRKKFDMFLREIEGQFPSKDTVYEYYVDPSKRAWVHWEEKIPAQWRYQPDAPFYKLLVPTIDTVRYSFIVGTLVKAKRNTLLVGDVGTGKTSIVENVLTSLDDNTYNTMTINMSSRTSAHALQSMLESRIEKRTKDVYVPIGGKRLVSFIDDLNMPAKDLFGSQPPLELLRQWIDYGCWYDLAKRTPKYVKDMQLVCAMGPTGGGRTSISPRLLNRFHVIYVAFPSEQQIKRIFGTLINQKLSDFEEDIKPLGDLMAAATYEVYRSVTNELLPTPSKSHYLFNLRDLSRVFQGIMRAHKDFYDSKESIIKLWVHECYRVFHDRLTDDADRTWFKTLIADKLGSLFGTSFNRLTKSGGAPIFGDFMRPNMDIMVYEEVPDVAKLRSIMEERLQEYNMERTQMNVVLFEDALSHLTRIHRVLKLPRGNILLVGVGGSGRQSMTKLAVYLADYKLFTIEVTKHYRRTEFYEDLKKLYIQCGVEKKHTVFLLSDNQLPDDTFLEDINNILSSGEVTDLFPKDQLANIMDTVRMEARNDRVPDSPDAMLSYFINRVRDHLHIVLCMSPVGKAFRNRIRMFPALISCTTIDWFSAWPLDALLEVGSKITTPVELAKELKDSLIKAFTSIQESVMAMNERMKLELLRNNYVTPTSYLEFVNGYVALLKQKKQELELASMKLSNGLNKLEDTRSKAETMSVELEKTKAKVAELQKQCEEFLVVIVQQRREADEQAKQLQSETERVTKEEAEVKIEAAKAQTELDAALPALERANEALKALKKNDVAEVRAYVKPPVAVEKVMNAVMILRKSEPSWAEAKRQLNDPNFMLELVNFDKDGMSDGVLKKVDKICADPEFQPDKIGKVSYAAMGLSVWVIAMQQYGHIYREVAPKKAAVDQALDTLAKKQAHLKAAKEKLEEINSKIGLLKEQYEKSTGEKERLRAEADETETRLTRAKKLIDGLSGERKRWEATIKEYEARIITLPGDCLLAAAFMAFAGPFPSEYRKDLVNGWNKLIKSIGMPLDSRFDFSTFMVEATNVREWNIKGLPMDGFSTENGVMVTKQTRWPLMVDPQGQAKKWITNLEQNLAVVDLKQSDYMRTLENAITFGTSVLVQDISEEIDPALNPILARAIIKQGSRMILKIGDSELDYHPDFRLYLSTKLPNPHYSPEICAQVAVVNFSVKMEGLEDQLLSRVVRNERPELEEQKDQLVTKIAGDKKKLRELEDTILHLLNTAQGSLLDDEKLIGALQSSKQTSIEVAKNLQVSEQTEAKIDKAREAYRPCAHRAALLFFVLNDLAKVDPMYQFSLPAYLELFGLSITKSAPSAEIAERIINLNEYHTYSVYANTCRGLFERHKLLFSFNVCIKILMSAGKINFDEYDFFLRGGLVLDKETQMPNPAKSWLAESLWDNVTELDKLNTFHGIAASFEQASHEWQRWFDSQDPEVAPLPGEWEAKCTEFSRLVILRCLRVDRLARAIGAFITNNIGKKYLEPPPSDTKSAFGDSTPITPLVFVLSPGVDPSEILRALAASMNMADKLKELSLGQDQAPIATKMIEEGLREGHWVFLANCHLCLSFMPALEKLVLSFSNAKPHKNFRLWLSSSPHPSFPISILQSSVKMTTEPPTGIKANMLRLYQQMDAKTFESCASPQRYKKLLYALAFFHALLLERKKFLTLGFNIPYEFNDSDFTTSEGILSKYLAKYEATPWDALRFLVAELNYGGRVTDALDQRVLNCYINRVFNDDAITTLNYTLCSLVTYHIPEDGPLSKYIDAIKVLPSRDEPEAFGLHLNAAISSQIQESEIMLDALLSMQPRVISKPSEGDSRESKVMLIATNLLSRVPELIDYDSVYIAKSNDPCPLNTFLLQEVVRYNKLLSMMKSALTDLVKAIKGEVVMSEELEVVYNCLYDAKIPPTWLRIYTSTKGLAAWSQDLVQRMAQIKKWCDNSTLPVFWLGGFTFPTGFLTAILQTSARKHGIPVDQLGWEFNIVASSPESITAGPKEGVYIRDLYLEGAGWHPEGHLTEPQPMKLTTTMPVMHFRPIEAKKKMAKGVYTCPCYLTSNRAGSMQFTSFVLNVDLKTEQDPDHWIQRGTALLLSQSN